jgi:hypothetical protein
LQGDKTFLVEKRKAKRVLERQVQTSFIELKMGTSGSCEAVNEPYGSKKDGYSLGQLARLLAL